MKKLLRKLKQKITRPPVMRHVRIVGERPPRKRCTAEQPLPTVFKLDHLNNMEDVMRRTEVVWDKFLGQYFQLAHQVLIKINLNTADPYPASTSPQFLHSLVDFLHRKGLRDIKVGDCASISALPTRRVADQLGLPALLEGKAEMIYFDQEDWVKVSIDGQYLHEVLVPESIYKADRIIYLANLKTHQLADFSFGMKLGVGLMHPRQRYYLHADHLAEKLVELNLAAAADFTFIDGRRAMISGGPINGQVEEAGLVIMGADPVAVDVESYRAMYRLKETFHCLENYHNDPFSMPQFQHACRVLPEGRQWKGYHLQEL